MTRDLLIGSTCIRLVLYTLVNSVIFGQHNITSSCTDLARRCSWLPDMSWVLRGTVASDRVRRLEYELCTTVCRNSASRRVGERSTCSRHIRGLRVHTSRAASDRSAPSSWQQRCCLRSSAQSHPLRSSRGSLITQRNPTVTCLQVAGGGTPNGVRNKYSAQRQDRTISAKVSK